MPTADHFRLSGRLSLAHGERLHSLAIDWQHTDDHDEIFLSTPFGQILALLRRDGERVQLQLADGRRFEASDAQSLARELLGFPLPLDEARQALFSAAIDEHDGWRIVRREHDPLGLPRRLEIRREATHLQLIIEEWNTMQ